ncbi:MAG TPA: hypothetical protein VG455_08475 [Acidimicrobiales bacterium]|nr:hypothetical protein [Acidimicrobiales bacterium]
MVALALAAGSWGGGGQETASDSTGDTDPPTSVDGGQTATTARRQRARLPGPPGPNGPDELVTAIRTWHGFLDAGVTPAQCRRLLASVQGELGTEAGQQTGGPPYVFLYRGIAQGCLGNLQAARSDLGRARAGDVGLGPEPSTDFTCNAQRLLVFGFDNFLDERISPSCPRPTTTEDTTDPTTSTTARTTTTTRASTTTR